MKITAIKAQVKKPERVSVFVDGTYHFSLTQTQLLDEKLRVGLEIDETRLAGLKKTSEAGKVFERILNFVMIRPRSHREVEDYCRRKQFDVAACADAIAKLGRRGYLNDEQFARAWVGSRQLTKPMSQRALRMELKQKGITDSVIAATIAESDYDETTALHQLIAKKQRMARYKDPQKLMQYLARQGFSYDAIKAAIADTTTEL